MSNGLLINYAGVPHEMSSLFPDNGLASLAAAVVQQKQSVRIYDFSTTRTIGQIYHSGIRSALAEMAPKVYGAGRLSQAEISDLRGIDREIQASEILFLQKVTEELDQYIRKNHVDWVGFKLWMGSIQQAMTIARALKEKNPGLKLFGGGPSADIFRQTILKQYPFLDVLVCCEAEEVLPRLIQWVQGKEKLSRIPNVMYRDGSEVVATPTRRIESLDLLPYPVYDPEVYPSMSGDQKMKILCFDDSRGCPMGCFFCPGTSKFGKCRMEKSPQRCIAELAYLKEQYNVRYFRFSGSNTSGRLLKRIAAGLGDAGLDIVFAVFSSATGLDAGSVKQLADVGLYSIFVGTESANPGQLAAHLGKKQSLDRLREVFQACRQANVFISTSMIHPAPFSSEAILQDNIDFLVENLKGYAHCSVAVYPAGLYPYTPWFDNLEAYGFTLNCPSREAYIEEALNYRYNIVLPRYLWKELPYQLNGKTFHEMLMETNRLAEALKQHDILPYLVEANLMMGPALGYAGHKEFAAESNRAFFCGDAETLESWNHRFNRQQSG